MPVRFLLYVGVTALTRRMVGSVQKDASPDAGVLIRASATLILAVAVLVLRYASAVYGSGAADCETKVE